MNAISPLDLVVIAVYLLGVTLWGAWLGRGQKGGSDYFLGGRELPWIAVMLSVVATETSTLTFLSIPGISYLGAMTFFQLTIGYLAGRAAVSLLLLPAYYRGELTTAYALLESRFGVPTRRLTSGIFMVTRLLADSVRLFATAIPLALVTGWPYPVSIAVIGVLTLVYTYFGGIKAVVWVDALQMVLYLVGAVIAALALQSLIAGGWGEVFARSAEAGKMAILDFQFTLSEPYTFWAGLVGGGFLTMGSHGADQLIVQRLLTCKDLKASQKALVWSAVAVMAQFIIFLLVGLGLWVFYNGMPFERSDEIFARFIVEQLPPGITGLLVAGIFAAAMSSLSSSINSLASASAYDFWAPLRGLVGDETRILRVGKRFTLLWATLLIGGAVLFIPLSTRTSAVEVALGVASVVYGGLLGAFGLGVLSKRAHQAGTIVGMVAGIGVVMTIWLTVPDRVAWPWFVLIGTLVTFGVGWILGRKRVA
jgi:SSS family transporter